MKRSKDTDLGAAKTIKKTVTEAVLLANRQNGGKSPGPRRTQNTRYNATKHSLLAKNIRFRDESEEKEFQKSVAELSRHHNPVGPTERALVEEMAIAQWRLQTVYGWESLEVKNRENPATAILDGLKENLEAQELSFFAATQQGWSARELSVRTGSRNSGEEEALLGLTDKTGHIMVEAKMSSSLSSSLETLLRYGTSIRRDFYKALKVLCQLQRERLELDGFLPSSQGEA
jgi:hypothetical protein